VTCGGLCPGLNNVIRAVVLSLHRHYGVNKVYGFRFGYEGLVRRIGHQPLELTPESVHRIHESGGSILGSSRGPQDPAEMVDYLKELGVGILFAVGGDGTLRGAQQIGEEAARRDLKISVIGVPKTIDNDISFVQRTFGFETAVTLLLGQSAVHAGLSGRTNMVVSFWNHQFTHVPISLAVSERQKIDPQDSLWSSVVTSTGQPWDMQ
jgi:6-phosphofructokinase